MDVYVGDRVQIVNGGIDVTNGRTAKAGKMYGEGGPLWATVEAIVNDWSTGGRYGLPSKVTKVRCSAGGVVVWQVQPQHIANGTVRSSDPGIVQTQPDNPPPTVIFTGSGDDSWKDTNGDSVGGLTGNLYTSTEAYAPRAESQLWDRGISTKMRYSDGRPAPDPTVSKVVTDRVPFIEKESITYTNNGGFRDLNEQERRSIGTRNIQVDASAIIPGVYKTAFQNPAKKRQMLNEDVENIVNSSAFPAKMVNATDLIAAKYDYQIIPGDRRYPKMITLEDKLKQARIAFGLPVHGSNQIAKAMKYFMYNRFKTPDINLAHNKSVTHVFFTRPDVNLLDYCGGANNQVLNNTETAMIWRRHPELFKLLTDRSRCGDPNNFNMLLSNQVTSFEIQDETISANKAGKSWNEYEMIYGDEYTGRTGGEFTCNFVDTSDYSVINLLKLWISYIDNVSKGAWSPSYDLLGEGDKNSITSSHVFTKTLDYAASAYVFKCGPDGEDVLYWSKYYGVFPANTGASALSWDLSNPIGDAPKLSIRFNYSAKRDLSPISLMEFNRAANIVNDVDAIGESSFNPELGHSVRPYVGAPFIEMKLGDMDLVSGSVDRKRYRTEIRLKFQKDATPDLSDDLLYRATLADRIV